MTKKIYFELGARMHSIHWELINYPPEGYEFITDKAVLDKTIIASDFILFHRRALEKILPLSLIKAWLERFIRRIPKDVELIYAYNHLVFRKVPWVVQVEWVHTLTGGDIKHFNKYKGLVERMLASEYCKGIFTWSEWAKESILLNLNCADFEHKMEVVPQAVSKKDFVKNYDEEKVKLLFVGSANNPHIFDHKGGKEVLEVFPILNRRHKNLELTMRVAIPQHIKNRYRETLAMENVQLIEEIQPWEVLEREFMSADIFLYPTHELHNTVILNAMSYELPVITNEIGSTGRVEDGVVGFVVKNSEKVPYFWNPKGLEFIPVGPIFQPHKFAKLVQNVDDEVVEELAEKTSMLIENPEMRRRMGKAARYEVEERKFSIKKRNETLKRIFDEATA